MSAEPAVDVDNTGIFSTFQDMEPTETPENQDLKNTGDDQESENPAQETQEQDETDSSTEDAPSTRVKAQLGDQEVEFDLISGEVDLETFRTGLMTKAAFVKKSEEAANKRKEADSLIAKYDDSLKTLRDKLDFKSQLSSEQLKELKESDPESYLKQKELLEEEEKLFTEWQQERNDALRAQQEEIQKAEVAKIPEKIPEWLDKKVMAAETKEISNLLVEEGFDEEQIKGIYDSRLVSVFRKAMLYDKAKKTPLQPKKKASPKHVKSRSTASKASGGDKSMEEIFYGGN